MRFTLSSDLFVMFNFMYKNLIFDLKIYIIFSRKDLIRVTYRVSHVHV